MALEDSNQLEDRMIDFGVNIGLLIEKLPKTKFGNHIANQLVRAGTAPAPNYGEACGAESKRDFTHKLGVVLKELRESRVWLKMILRGNLLPSNPPTELLDECVQLNKIIGKSVVTVKSKKDSKTKSQIKN